MRTALSLMATRSITKMATHLTTIWATWSASLVRLMHSITPIITHLNGEKRCSNGQTTFETLLPSGMAPKKAVNGISGWASRHGWGAPANHSCVSTAAHNMNPERFMARTAFAQTSVAPLPAAKAVQTMNSGRVPVVATPLLPTDTASNDSAPVVVAGLLDLGEIAPVYNLTVDNAVGEYFANGVLVHNCDATRYAVKYGDKRKFKYG